MARSSGSNRVCVRLEILAVVVVVTAVLAIVGQEKALQGAYRRTQPIMMTTTTTMMTSPLRSSSGTISITRSIPDWNGNTTTTTTSAAPSARQIAQTSNTPPLVLSASSSSSPPLSLSFAPIPDVGQGCDHYERSIDDIQLHVLGWRRAESLQTLLEQLQNATYPTTTTTSISIDYNETYAHPIPLYIHLDGGASDQVKALVHSFQWTHGPLHLDIRNQSHGLRGMWLGALGDAAELAGDNALLLCFEDDMRVSPDYFLWLLRMVDHYGKHPQCRDANLMGISLAPNKIDELKKPFTRWNAQDVWKDAYGSSSQHAAYLSVLPGSWGAAYWSDRWMEFRKFCKVRMAEPFYDTQVEGNAEPGKYDDLQLSPPELFIPGARSNVWPKSWKRFMIDFMYARGSVFLYPNLQGEKGFGTTLALAGEHVGTKKNLKYQNPRVAELARSVKDVTGILPRYGDLKVLDLWLQPTTREDLAADGAKFLRSIMQHCTHDCKELLDLWSTPGILGAVRSVKGGDGPPVCLPDLFMPTSVTLDEPSPRKEQYLLVEPQYGANNQILNIVHGMYWATVLDRRLVIPPIFVPRVKDFQTVPMQDWPVTNEVLDFAMEPTKVLSIGHKTPIPPIQYRDWKKLNVQTNRVLRVTHDATWDDMSWMLMNDIRMGERDASTVEVDLRDFFRDKPKAARMHQLLGGCNDEVLAFQSLFMTKLVGFDKYSAASRMVLLSSKARKTYDSLKALFQKQLGSDKKYMCMHVRGDDFNQMCPAVENATSGIFIYDKLSREGYACRTPVEQIRRTLNSRGMPTLLMSDSAPEVADLLKDSPVPVVSSDWVQRTVAQLSPESSPTTLELLSLVLEQELCFESAVSILNVFSTFSKRIRYRRTGGSAEHITNQYGETLHWMKDESKMLKRI